MLESIIVRSIREHLEGHEVIHDRQHGVTKGRSCLTKFLLFSNKVIEAGERDEDWCNILLRKWRSIEYLTRGCLHRVKAHGMEGKCRTVSGHGSPVLGARSLHH